MDEPWLRAFKARELIDRSHLVLENNQRDPDIVLQMKRARRDRLWCYIKSKDKPPPRFQHKSSNAMDVPAVISLTERGRSQRDLIKTSVCESYISSCCEDQSLFFSETRYCLLLSTTRPDTRTARIRLLACRTRGNCPGRRSESRSGAATSLILETRLPSRSKTWLESSTASLQVVV